MYYRRKVLLALLEIFGGTLAPIDCYKLMFLFCQRVGQNYYDFFPYKYGACSFVLYQDKLRLANLGKISKDEKFQLCDHESYINSLHISDQIELRALANEMKSIRGNQLLHKVYLEYP